MQSEGQRTEKQKMLAGELYRADDPELRADRAHCQAVLTEFNATLDSDRRIDLLRSLGATIEDGVDIQPPLRCDYGYNLTIRAGAFLNYGTVILDCASVTIGAGAQIGPNVQLLAADHPRELTLRRQGLESAAPIIIGADAWLGGGAIVLPGVAVGGGSIVGAGSVVTRDVPPGMVVAGSPARVLRAL